MIEVIDNTVQLAVTLFGTFFAARIATKWRSQHYAILACFYGTFALGLVYWLVYLALMSYTPQIFYVSDLSWAASFLFLLIFVLSIQTPEEKTFRHPAQWIGPVLSIFLTAFYILRDPGELLVGVLWCVLLAGVSYFATGGLLYARKQSNELRNRQRAYALLLVFFVIEHALWVSSSFWISDTLTNPYFWFDFMLTGTLLALLPVVRKAVTP